MSGLALSEMRTQDSGTAIKWFSGRISLIPSAFDWTSAERLVGVVFNSHP